MRVVLQILSCPIDLQVSILSGIITELHWCTAIHTRVVVPAQGSLDGEPFVPAYDINEYHESVLHISLGGRQHRATAEQITACPLESFAALWTVRQPVKHVQYDAALPSACVLFCTCIE